ncbi:4409_t:CDS:2 [Paraglomus brasilianum]|uniref:4409_t:CDS:1 n=1 Tax=Paraglomus brasilianum TaxID=144538 RepID=A0A9N9FV32_9GLOM|nr:4409_t:CDS:2 [Paraglomus brasilianum]
MCSQSVPDESTSTSSAASSPSPPSLTAILFNFSKTLTPFECDLLRNPPYDLTISLESLLDPMRKRRRNYIRNNSLPPRPRNSWLIFRQDFESRLRIRYPNGLYSIQDVSKIAGKDWRRQSQIVKQYFNVLAKLVRQQHKCVYPDYAYRPQKKQRKAENKWLFKVMDKDNFVRCEKREDIANERNIEAGNDGLMINLDDYDFSDDIRTDDIDVSQLPTLLYR